PNGSYAAQFVVTGEPPSDQLLVEATATDNVQQRSELAETSLALPRQNQGGQRTTFGGAKPGDDLGSKLQKKVPPTKKGWETATAQGEVTVCGAIAGEKGAGASQYYRYD